MKQPLAHSLLLLLFMSCLCLGSTKKSTHKKTHVAKHNNKRWKIKTVDGREKGKGDDYQEVDVNGKRLSHKNTKKGITGTFFRCKTCDRHVSDTLYLQYEMKILKNICVTRPTSEA